MIPLVARRITNPHWRRRGSSSMLPRVEVALRAAVRPLEPVDWPDVRSIYELGIASGRATLETAAPSWELWDEAHVRGHRWVATDGGVVAGWAALARVRGLAGDGVAESSVYVHPHRQRRGVGTALLAHLVERSERAGFWTLEARIVEGNDASLRLHVRHGFRVVGVRERIGRLNGEWRNVLLLERRSRIVGR